MVKERVSATIDPETSHVIDKLMKNGKYRNKAHLIEEAILLLAKETK
ncbi:MAG: ribbon-helix-helix protein, CopG family [Candidatus Pacearchaeota archaeon]